MIRSFRCDLHVHTCLSPCADLDIFPSALVGRAVVEKLDVIAVCDHNASENVPHVFRAALGSGLTVFPGMEITSREEVHLLAIFDSLSPLQRLQEVIYRHLPGKNDEERFGCQAIVNDLDEVEGFNERLLIGATGLSLDELVRDIHSLGGVAVAAHIDRECFGLMGQLGFVDPSIPFDAMEISGVSGSAGARQRYPELAHHPFIESSDSHRIGEIGRRCTEIYMEEPTVSELKMAFAGRGGRYIV
ncbi:MAG: PHP domain-containing protein [Pseudomonadota bacterium]